MIWGRAYFAIQAAAGAVWWIAVAVFPFVRESTLGSLNPILVAVLDIPLFVLASTAAAAGVRAAAWVAASWSILVAIGLAFYATVTAEAGWGVLIMGGAAAGSVIALSLLVLGSVPTGWIVSGPFAFRPASSRSNAAVNVWTTLAQIVVFWGFFLGVVPLVLTMFERLWVVGIPFPALVPYVGTLVFVLASALGIWSAVAMSVRGQGTPLPAAMPNWLVVAGPYRFVRNPMAIAGFVQGMAVGLMWSSWIVTVYALLGSFLWNYAIRPHEERDLESRFGDEFRRYRDAVRCWIPRLPEPATVVSR